MLIGHTIPPVTPSRGHCEPLVAFSYGSVYPNGRCRDNSTSDGMNSYAPITSEQKHRHRSGSSAFVVIYIHNYYTRSLNHEHAFYYHSRKTVCKIFQNTKLEYRYADFVKPVRTPRQPMWERICAGRSRLGSPRTTPGIRR